MLRGSPVDIVWKFGERGGNSVSSLSLDWLNDADDTYLMSSAELIFRCHSSGYSRDQLALFAWSRGFEPRSYETPREPRTQA
ncbi:hypothetical protein TNCV_542971 [Trichonephila clavipes]|nr:hypothetical protein TNCV_542971 [Trichonephila clavipes]